MTPESRLKNACTRRLRQIQTLDPTLVFRKRWGTPMGLTGDPDLTGLWRGVHFEIELKTPGNSPTPLQQCRLDQWQAAGARAFVVHSLSEMNAAIEHLRPSDRP